MPKLKTHKSTSKRIHVTGKKKFIQRYTHQDHYNSRESGNKKRKKRRDVTSSKANSRNIKKGLPYI